MGRFMVITLSGWCLLHLQAESADKALAEEHDTLGFVKAKCMVQCMGLDVVDPGVGREFCAAVRGAPLANRGTQCLRNTCPAYSRHDVNAFEKEHGRRLATVDVVVPHGGFGESGRRVVVGEGDECHVAMRVGQATAEFREYACRRLRVARADVATNTMSQYRGVTQPEPYMRMEACLNR